MLNPDVLVLFLATPAPAQPLSRADASIAKETTTPGDPFRSFRPLARTAFPPDTCLTLTPAGAAALRPVLLGEATPNPPRSRQWCTRPQPADRVRQ